MTIQSVCNNGARQSHDSGPIRQRMSFASKRQHPITRGVVVLLRARRPVAILGGVVSSSIAALNRVRLRGTAIHVSPEASETLTPLRTHTNALAAVVVKLRVLGVLATADHANPNPIFRRVGLAMRAIGLRRFVASDTPARDRLPVPQILRQDRDNGAATAATHPARAMMGARRRASVRHHRQFMECLTQQIVSLHSITLQF